MGSKFKLGDRVAKVDDVKDRAIGSEKVPLFSTSEVTCVLEQTHSYTYYLDGRVFSCKEENLVLKKDIRKVALKHLVELIEDVINASEGGD